MDVVSHRNELMLGTREEDQNLVGACPFRRERDNNLTAQTPIGLVGISYHTATLQIRSKVGVAAGKLEKMLRCFAEAGFSEAIILSTCNRTEVYFVGGSHAEAGMILAAGSGIRPDDLEPH